MAAMEHAKKYVLVNPEMYRPSMPEKSLSDLDREIQATLNGNLPDDQKAKLYTLTLNKYKSHENSTKPPQPKLGLDSELADALPLAQQHKVKKLLRLIKDNPDVDWSDKGELIYKQHLISQSHVADLFDDALATKRPVDGPVGWEEFDSVLESSKVPSTLAKRRKASTVKNRSSSRRRRPSKWITD